MYHPTILSYLADIHRDELLRDAQTYGTAGPAAVRVGVQLGRLLLVVAIVIALTTMLGSSL